MHLHQRHMLVGRCVVDQVRPGRAEHMFDHIHMFDIPDQGLDLQPGVELPELPVDFKQRGFGVVQQDHALRCKRGNLAAQLRSNGAAGPGHQHGLARHAFQDGAGIEIDRVAPQQILNLEVAHFLDADLAGKGILEQRHRIKLYVQAITARHDALEQSRCRRRNGKQDEVNLVLADTIRHLRNIPQHRNAMDIAALLNEVLIHKTHHMHLLPHKPAIHHAQHRLAQIPRPHNQRATHLGGIHLAGLVPVAVAPEAHADPQAHQQCHAQHPIQNVDRARHYIAMSDHQIPSRKEHDRPQRDRLEQLDKIIKAGITVQTAMHPERQQNPHADHHNHREPDPHRHHMGIGNVAKIKPQQKRTQKRRRARRRRDAHRQHHMVVSQPCFKSIKHLTHPHTKTTRTQPAQTI